MYPHKCSCSRVPYSPTIPTRPPRINTQTSTKSFTDKLIETPPLPCGPTNKKKSRRKNLTTSNNFNLHPNVSSKQSLAHESKKTSKTKVLIKDFINFFI